MDSIIILSCEEDLTYYVSFRPLLQCYVSPITANETSNRLLIMNVNHLRTPGLPTTRHIIFLKYFHVTQLNAIVISEDGSLLNPP